MLSNEALVTGNLTMSFARTSEDVETYVLQLLFKTLQTKLESSFFLQVCLLSHGARSNP